MSLHVLNMLNKMVTVASNLQGADLEHAV